MEMLNKSGIYQIRNLINNKIYVGSAFDLGRRIKAHLKSLKHKTHHNIHLQDSFNKYGEENFVFEILELVGSLLNESKLSFKKRLVDQKEQYYLDTLLFASENNEKFYKLGYNICRKAANPRLGLTASSISKEKCSNSLMNHYVSLETRKKQALAKLGKTTIRKGIKKTPKQLEMIGSQKPIIQLNLEGDFVAEFVSISEGGRQLNIKQIGEVCRGQQKTAGGFKFMYKSQYELLNNKICQN